MRLRPYQREAIAAICASGQRRQIVALPTGTGKTIIFAHAIRDVVCAHGRAIVLVHRDALVTRRGPHGPARCHGAGKPGLGHRQGL
jgi:superfamily II DNA or RNA helicase